jgi:hypothetical protein
VGIGPLRTGTFNVADVGIMLGAGLFVLGGLGWKPKIRTCAQPEGTPPGSAPTGIGPV